MITEQTAIAIIELKKEYYTAKKIKLQTRQEQLRKENEVVLATAYELLIDQVKETEKDLNEIIKHIGNIASYQENCINLINKTLKK